MLYLMIRTQCGSVQQPRRVSGLLYRDQLHHLPEPAAGTIHLFTNLGAAWPSVPSNLFADPTVKPLTNVGLAYMNIHSGRN